MELSGENQAEFRWYGHVKSGGRGLEHWYSRAGVLFFLRVLLDEGKNVEVLHLPVWKKAVHGIL